jgi:hypothetical protein
MSSVDFVRENQTGNDNFFMKNEQKSYIRHRWFSIDLIPTDDSTQCETLYTQKNHIAIHKNINFILCQRTYTTGTGSY